MSRPITQNELRRLFPNATQDVLRINSGVSDRNADKTDVSKRRPGNAPPQHDKNKKAHSGFYFVLVKSYQFQLQDFDNPLEKLHVDALRYAGILPDDNPSICDGRVERIKVATRAEEKTVIEIYFEQL